MEAQCGWMLHPFIEHMPSQPRTQHPNLLDHHCLLQAVWGHEPQNQLSVSGDFTDILLTEHSLLETLFLLVADPFL